MDLNVKLLLACSSEQTDFTGSANTYEILLEKQHREAGRRAEGKDGVTVVFYAI
jgi:hypothetical protein